MLPESWTPSWQLRAAGALRSAVTVGGTYAVLWFDQVFRFGAVIATRDSWTYRISPFRKRRRLERWLRMRTGFEGMELTITQAAAAARAENPGWPADGASSPVGVLGACLLCVLGAAGVVLAALVRPQAGGWLLRAGADLLTAWWGIVGAVIGIIGVWLLCRAVTRAVSARPGPGLR